jgi:putative RecB family exonuclease
MPLYSHSRLQTYENCPLQFKYRYVDKIETEVEQTIEAFLGSRVHEALEKLYHDLKMTRQTSLDELLSYFNQIWQKNWLDSILVVRKEYAPEDYRKLGEKCISDYYRHYHPFDQGKTLSLEQIILVPLDKEGKYRIRGFIDRIVLTGDRRYEIHDYKTSGYLPDQATLDSDRQLALYQIGVEERWKDVREVDLVWHYLVFDREMRSRRAPAELKELKTQTIELINQIEKAKKDEKFPPNESNLCDWCQFYSICPSKKHFYQVELLPPEDYLKDGGVQLVNSYVNLMKKRKELESEKKALEELIYNYVRNENLQVIRGSDSKLNVKIEEKEKLPTKASDSEEWERLEKLVRNLKIWDQVSKLDPHLLLDKIRKEVWDKETIKKLKEFLTAEEERRIYTSKLGDEDKLSD